SALRVTPGPPPGPAAGSLPTAPDGEGHLRVSLPGRAEDAAPGAARPVVPGARRPSWAERSAPDAVTAPGPDRLRPGRSPRSEEAYGSERTPPCTPERGSAAPHAPAPPPAPLSGLPTPPRGTQVPPDAREAPRRRGGIGAWARRLTGGGRAEGGDSAAHGTGAPADTAAPDTTPPPRTGGPGGTGRTEAWPDPAAVLLTALDPGPRLWERAPGHPEALVVRLGTAERAELASVPVTVGLREAGSLGLAGPRPRLLGLARSVLAQLTALHAPADLEVVLVAADARVPLERRVQDWGWLGWLPHLRPAHGQDCRLLLAYDPDQAHARVAELTRRLDEGPLGPGWAQANPTSVAEAAARTEAPYTVVVVDGDPGSAALRETLARLAAAGAAAGIHLVCLAETEPASPRFPVAAAYEAACGVSGAFRECGAVGLLSGDVATALRLMRTAGGRPATVQVTETTTLTYKKVRGDEPS
ncbi:hypothetical protein I3F58_28955, partial [Streptomyces sp. MUM 203J]|nr:hypothetical protein [Streptomyces sp. MUM 203J]